MRQITREAIQAFRAGYKFSKANTQVRVAGDTVGLFLHGNQIARYRGDISTLEITTCGWATNTTKERLNGLPGVSIHQANWDWYLNGQLWDGKWTKVRH